MPTALRTPACSASTPAPAYSRGIDQPLNGANLAPAATWRSCSGERISSSSATGFPSSPYGWRTYPRASEGRIATLRGLRPLLPRQDDIVPIAPLPSLTVARALPRNPDVLVVGYTGEGLREMPSAVASAFTKRFGSTPGQMAAALGAKQGDDHFVTLPAAGDGPRIVVVGLESAQPTPEDLRRAAGAGVRHAAEMADSSRLAVAVALGSTDPVEAQAVAEGALLGSYRYSPISGKADDDGSVSTITVVHEAREKLDGIAAAAEIVARAVVTAREWVNIPANLLFPSSFADQVRELVGRTGIGVEVLDETALARGSYGGTTVENGNSDAEGRLVMADALARSAEDQPDLVVDVATLTGACVVALGERTAGVMSNDQDTADRVLDAAEAAGESCWPLPIPSEIRPKLDSKVADLRSTGTDRWGGALVAAAFLREFVPEGTPWAHIDIAGPAFHDKKPYGYVGAGGTGAGVRTLIALAGSLAD